MRCACSQCPSDYPTCRIGRPNAVADVPALEPLLIRQLNLWIIVFGSRWVLSFEELLEASEEGVAYLYRVTCVVGLIYFLGEI